MPIDGYWQKIQSRICKRCVDGDGYGNCHLPGTEECSLRHYLPDIIKTVSEIREEKIDAYVARLRKNVCAVCEDQTADLVCQKRNRLECALDRYYPLVIDIIETIREDDPHVHAV